MAAKVVTSLTPGTETRYIADARLREPRYIADRKTRYIADGTNKKNLLNH